jgi:tellurite resistance protein TehA-like permease
MADTTPTTSTGEDKLGAGLWIVSFLFPIVGIILYFVYKNDNKPAKAKSACTAALVALGLWILFYIIIFVIVGVATVNMPAQ